LAEPADVRADLYGIVPDIMTFGKGSEALSLSGIWQANA